MRLIYQCTCSCFIYLLYIMLQERAGKIRGTSRNLTEKYVFQSLAYVQIHIDIHVFT